MQAAFINGYYEVIGDLYNAGASVNIQCGQYGNALSSAIEGSCATLVSSLLRHHDANPNSPVRKYGFPLQKAIVCRPDDDGL